MRFVFGGRGIKEGEKEEIEKIDREIEKIMKY